MPPSTNRTQRRNPRDFTGIRGEQLAKEAAARKQQEQTDIDAALEEEAEKKRNTEVDYSTHRRAPQEVEVDGEVTVEEVEVTVPTRRIRVSDDIQEMTFGRNILAEAVLDQNGQVVAPARLGGLRQFNFERGRWYTVDAGLADHLEFLGYLVDYLWI
jgi:hypothetical protein